jgi:hypothetical protein
LRAHPASAITRTTTGRICSFGDNDRRPFRRRNCVFANSRRSSAQCAGCAVAMLIIPIRGRGRLRPLFAAEARQSWTENLNLSLTTTMNELLIDFDFKSAASIRSLPHQPGDIVNHARHRPNGGKVAEDQASSGFRAVAANASTKPVREDRSPAFVGSRPGADHFGLRGRSEAEEGRVALA